LSVVSLLLIHPGVQSFTQKQQNALRFPALVATESTSTLPSLASRVVERLQGDWDNFGQPNVEHIHATVRKVSDKGVLAAYYFDGNPEWLFRLRYYELIEHEDKTLMYLYTVSPTLQEEITGVSPDAWSFRNETTLLPRCEIQWQDQVDNDCMLATLVHTNVTIRSQVPPHRTIRIQEELQLYADALILGDVGTDVATNRVVYGHVDDPFLLQRVPSSDHWTCVGPASDEYHDYKQDTYTAPSFYRNQ